MRRFVKIAPVTAAILAGVIALVIATTNPVFMSVFTAGAALVAVGVMAIILTK